MKSILIVISAPDALGRFSEILSNAGYHVIAAESGEEAMELATSVYPDLFLIAIVMPTLANCIPAARTLRPEIWTNSPARDCHSHRY